MKTKLKNKKGDIKTLVYIIAAFLIALVIIWISLKAKWDSIPIICDIFKTC